MFALLLRSLCAPFGCVVLVIKVFVIVFAGAIYYHRPYMPLCAIVTCTVIMILH